MARLSNLKKLEEELGFVKIAKVYEREEYVIYPIPNPEDIRISFLYDSNEKKVILPGIIEKLTKIDPKEYYVLKEYHNFKEFYDFVKKMKEET